MFYWVLYHTGMGVLAVVFILGINHKLRDMPRFQATLAAYQLFPPSAASVAAPLVVLLEIVAVLALLMPVGPGVWLALSLLTLYTGALAINLLRGRTDIDCGCGGQPTPISAWLLARNGLLGLLAYPYTTGETMGEPAIGPAAWVLVVALVGLVSLLYVTAEQLLTNRYLGRVDAN